MTRTIEDTDEAPVLIEVVFDWYLRRLTTDQFTNR